LSFSNVEINGLGIQEKDVLVSINNEAVNMENIDRLFESYFSDNDDGKDVSIEIIRDGEKMRLKGSPQKAVKQMSNYIEPVSNPDLKAINNMNKFKGTVN
jgi:S1-C subfamily serine protease